MKSKVLKTLAKIIAVFLILFAIANKLFFLFGTALIILIFLIFVN